MVQRKFSGIISKMNKKCKKAISLFTSLTTILWLSGIAALGFPTAADSADHYLIRGPDGIKVYIVMGAYKRHIFNPEVFNMYGHLKWSDIEEVSQTVLDSYTTSDLYRVDTDYRVFSVTADGGKRHLNMTAAEFVTAGYSWGQIFIINEKEGNFYTLGADLIAAEPTASPTPTPTPEAGALTVVLADDNPASANIPYGVTGVPFLKFTVSGITTLDEVVVTRSGVGSAGDFDGVYLYDGSTRLTSSRSVASDTNAATFVNLGLAVGTGKTLTVKADINNSTDLVGRQDRFSVTSVDGTAVTGIIGNLMSYANVVASTADIAGTSAAWQVTLGASNVEVAKFSIEAGGTSNLLVNGITIRHGGTLNNEYLSKMVMKVGTTEVGTCAALTGDKAVFAFPTAYTIPKSQTKNFVVYGDITGGRANDNIQFYLDYNCDLDAIDATYGYGPVLDNTWASGSQIVTVAGGQVTIGDNGPPVSEYAQNSTNLDFLKFSLSAERNITVKKIKVTMAVKTAAGALIAKGTTDHTDENWDYLKNIKIVDLTSGNTLVGPLDDADAGGNETWVAQKGYQKEFTDQFDISAGATRQLSLKADIDTNFTDTYSVTMSIDLSVANYVYDSSAGQYVLAAKIVPNTLTGRAMTISSSSLTLAKASTPVSATYVRGATSVDGLGIILTAGTADAVKLNKLVVRVYADDSYATGVYFANSGLGDEAANTIVQTVSLYDDAGTLIKGPANLSLSAGSVWAAGAYYKAEFTNLAYDFAAGAQKKFVVKAALLNTFDGTKYIAFDVKPSADAEGENSKGSPLSFTTLTTALNLPGNNTHTPVITCSAAGTLTAAVDASTPNKAIVVAGTSGVEFTKYKFTAANEPIVITALQLTNAHSGTAGDYDDNISKVTLSYTGTDGEPAEKVGYLIDGVLTLASGQVAILVPKDSSSVLTIKADLKTIDGGADTGDKPKLYLTTAAGNLTANFITLGSSSNQTSLGTTVALDNTNVNEMIVRKTKPTLASGTLPDATLGTGTKTLYKWTVSADSAADLSWKAVTFSMTGMMYNTAFRTIGADDVTTPVYDGIYGIVDGDGTADVKFIDETTTKVYNDATGVQVAGAFYYRSRVTTADTGGYYLVFVPTNEEEVGKGTTKTYRLDGDIANVVATGTGNLGNINVKIADLSSATVTNTYDLVAGANDADSITAAAASVPGVSFVWSDRSIANHGVGTADWADDYKVSGLPTTTLTMSK